MIGYLDLNTRPGQDMRAIRLIFGALQSSFPRTFCYVSESMRILPSLNLLALLGFCTLVVSANATDKVFPTLNFSIDPELQQALDESLQKLRLGNAVAEKHLAVSLVDITNPYYPRMAEVNGDVMLYAASLPKIAILFGALQKAHDGQLTLDAAMREKLVNMIRHSSNADASEVLSIVGEEYLAELLQSEGYEFYKPEQGGLWVGKSYGKGPAWKRDPLFNISHGASSREVSRFYYMLATNRLVSPQSCAIMKEILSKPAVSHKFVSGIRSVHPDARIYRKSGTWRTYHSDSAIIERDGKQYIIVALANDPNGSKWLEKIIVEMDNIIFANDAVDRVAHVGWGESSPHETEALLH